MKKKRILLIFALVALTVATSLLAVSCSGAVKISFETNGAAAISQASVESGTEYTLPTPEERSGYSFEGWYESADFSGEAVTTVKAESDVTYYAKWAQLFTLTLDADGGELSATSLTLKEGANIYNAVKDLVPTKSGMTFGAWFANGSELSGSATISSSMTLTARYKVDYTVRVYLQNTSLDGYEEAKSLTGQAYVGETFAPSVLQDGFTLAQNAASVSEKVLSATASENVFALYFDRNTVEITFNSNYPDDIELADETSTVSAIYGVAASDPDYSAEGYVLIGWSTSKNGEAVYLSDYVNNTLYSQQSAKGILPSSDVTLYAVWQTPYTDLFEGSDNIFLVNGSVYLLRGGVFFEGTYSSSKGEFSFIALDGTEDIVLRGKLKDDNQFIYYSTERGETTYTLYEVGNGFVDTTHLYFNSDDTIGYTYKGESDVTSSESFGTYVLTDDGDYVITFTSGALEDQTMTVRLVTETDSSEQSRAAFMIRNDEEYNLGDIYYFAVYNGELTPYNYILNFNGFGSATLSLSSSSTTYSYSQSTVKDGCFDLTDQSSGKIAYTIKVQEDLGYKLNGFVIYNDEFDATYTSTADSSSTLVLDGFYTATITKDGKTASGVYTYGSSYLGGYIVSFSVDFGTIDKSDKQDFLVRIDTVTDDSVIGGESTSKNIFEEKTQSYAEYCYYNYTASSSYYRYTVPILVFGEEENKLSVYGSAASGYVKVLYGTYTYDSTNLKYVFTADSDYSTDVEVATTPVDLTNVSKLVFGLATSSTSSSSYPVFYIYSIETTDSEEPVDADTVYTSSGDGTLTLVGGFAIYSLGGNSYYGVYATGTSDTSLLRVSLSDGSYLYFEIDSDAQTFVRLTTSPFTAYKYLPTSGSLDADTTLYVDGKGNGVYTFVTEDESGTESTTEINGTVELYDETESGSGIYEFKSDEITFRFILLTTSSYNCFAVYDQSLDNIYYGENDETLELDGFGYQAKYTDENGESAYCSYVVVSDSVLYVYIDDVGVYIDIDEDGKFTRRGNEYGTYLLTDNLSGVTDDEGRYMYAALDGYGKLTILSYDSETENVIYIDEEGTYVLQSNGMYVFTFKQNASTTVIYTGTLGTISSVSAFIVQHKEVAMSFTDESDLSVLVLDGCGNAVFYDENGKMETGSYLIVTEGFLYYVNDEGTDACIYNFDSENAVVSHVTFKARAYYTSELDSLVFSRYGFVIYNGETRSYYNVDDEGNVYIYTFDKDNENANIYGFVLDESFGKFETNKTWSGKDFVENAGGAIITFTRSSSDMYDDAVYNYPIRVQSDDGETIYQITSLMFSPKSSAEFLVSGYVNITYGDSALTNRSCYVGRELKDDGTYGMYVVWGSYQFDITINYDGTDEGNQFAVTSMQMAVYAYSNTYLYYLYLYSVLDSLRGTSYASSYSNNIGLVCLVYDYDSAGELTNSYFSGAFGTKSGMVDTTGEIVSVSQKTFSYNENSGLFSVEFVGDDGYTYRIHFYISSGYVSVFGVYSYQLAAFTRVETLSTDGYEVEVERVITSDSSSLSAGTYWQITLKKDGIALEMDGGSFIRSGIVYYIVRNTDENGTITDTTYFTISMISDSSSSATVPVYLTDSLTVTATAVETKYSSDGSVYFDLDSDNNVTQIVSNGTVYLVGVGSSSYDSETKTYTVKTVSGATFTITQGDDGSYTVTLNETDNDAE